VAPSPPASRLPICDLRSYIENLPVPTFSSLRFQSYTHPPRPPSTPLQINPTYVLILPATCEEKGTFEAYALVTLQSELRFTFTYPPQQWHWLVITVASDDWKVSQLPSDPINVVTVRAAVTLITM
jgi:hypothetical protein